MHIVECKVGRECILVECSLAVLGKYYGFSNVLTRNRTSTQKQDSSKAGGGQAATIFLLLSAGSFCSCYVFLRCVTSG